ncbi:MAG: ABC transporter substrate-binding protein [Microbacterium sp.]
MKHRTQRKETTKSKLSKGLVALLVVTALLGTSPALAASADKPVRGGTVTVIAAEPPTMNPTTWGNGAIVGGAGAQVYGALVYQDVLTKNEEPSMLKSWSVSPDATTYTLKLHPNMKFTDGTPLNSAAIKANFDWHAAPESRSVGIDSARQVVSVDTSDPLVAKVTLNTPDAAWIYNVNDRLSNMVSPAAIAKFGSAYGTSVDKVVGAGPFVLTEWTRGSQMVFERNPNYWDAPRPYLDKVIIKFIADPAAAQNTLLTRGADYGAVSSSDAKSQYEAAGMKFVPSRLDNFTNHTMYQFNFMRPPFNDIDARRAVVAALDPKKIAAAQGGEVSKGITETDSPWYSKLGLFPKFDRDKAQKLINAWSQKNGGTPLEFTITSTGSGAGLGGDAEVIQAALAGYQNLKVNVQFIPSSQVVTLGQSGNFDLYPSALGGFEPSGTLRTKLFTNAGRNYGKYSSPEMDAALVAGDTTGIEAERVKEYGKVQQLILRDLPMWVIPYRPALPPLAVITNKSFHYTGGGLTMMLNTATSWMGKKP